jgi:hypothetical protein
MKEKEEKEKKKVMKYGELKRDKAFEKEIVRQIQRSRKTKIERRMGGKRIREKDVRMRRRVERRKDKEESSRRREGRRRKFMILSRTCLPVIISVMNSLSTH